MGEPITADNYDDYKDALYIAGSNNTYELKDITHLTDIPQLPNDASTKDYTVLADNGTFTWVEPTASSPLIETTYSALKTLRDNSQLIPGIQYRITDYQCTTTTTSTSSAGHQFDIVVVADSTNKLNENARAVLHSGDTYFANCKLESWQLKYCIDNDTTRFE